MSDEYTSEELEQLPQTDMVFEKPNVDLNDHKLVQQGYMVMDVCQSHPAISFSIPSGKTLIRKDGAYSLIDERVS